MQLHQFVSKHFETEQGNSLKLSMFPKISVVTPSFGQESFIERTILSVLNQNYPNVEFIIIDDASEDNSNEIINKYKNFLTLVGDGINRGQTTAINRGLRMATGDLITFQNADDLFAPNAFLEIAQAYYKHPDSELFFGNIYIIDKNDVISNKMRMTPYSYEEQLNLGMQMHNQSMFFKPSLLKKKGFLNESLNYSFDYEIVLRFTENEEVKPKYVENLWGAFRIHSASKTSNITSQYKQEFVAIRQHYKDKRRKIKSIFLIKLKSYFRKTLYYLYRGQIKYLFYKFNNL